MKTPKMEVVYRHYNGKLDYFLSSKVETMDELHHVINVDKSLYGVNHLRIKAPSDEIFDDILQSKGFRPIYIGHSLDIPLSLRYSTHSPVTVVELNAHDPILLTAIRKLIRECAERDGSDFNSELTDPAWYTLGDRNMVAVIDGELAGFRTYYETEDVIQMCLGYVEPKHRLKGIYTDLLKRTINRASQLGKKQILVSTDTTDHPMPKILQRYGFVPKTKTWIL